MYSLLKFAQNKRTFHLYNVLNLHSCCIVSRPISTFARYCRYLATEVIKNILILQHNFIAFSSKYKVQNFDFGDNFNVLLDIFKRQVLANSRFLLRYVYNSGRVIVKGDRNFMTYLNYCRARTWQIWPPFHHGLQKPRLHKTHEPSIFIWTASPLK